MNKQELIDKAVDELRGMVPDHTSEKYGFCMNVIYMPFLPIKEQYVCHVDEFEKRARELGWINGYKYGVEYPTNGQKPDLPYDVVVKIKTDNGHWYNDAGLTEDIVACWFWEDSIAFRIVDKRYKPKSETSNEFFEKNEPTFYGKPKAEKFDNSWRERGELPPVDSIVEYDNCGSFVKTKILAHHPEKNCAWHECIIGSFSDGTSYSTDSPQAFRPIKTERENFVDTATNIMMKNCDSYGKAAEAMFDAGFKAPS